MIATDLRFLLGGPTFDQHDREGILTVYVVLHEKSNRRDLTAFLITAKKESAIISKGEDERKYLIRAQRRRKRRESPHRERYSDEY